EPRQLATRVVPDRDRRVREHRPGGRGERRAEDEAVNDSLRAAVAALDGDVELSADEARSLLDLAAHAAHASGNPAHPSLVCYLVGRLQGERGLGEVAEAVRSATS